MTLEAFWTAMLPSLCVSAIMMVFAGRQSRRERRMQNRMLVQKRSEQVQLDLTLATAKLAYAAAMAVKNGKPNGEVEEGIAQYKAAMANFKQFERELFEICHCRLILRNGKFQTI